MMRDPEPPQAISWRAIADLEPPPRRWALTGWMGFGHTTLLVGSGGIGKTLLAQQLAAALALGRDFIDQVPAPLNVLMWACEDDAAELWRRQVAIAHSMNVGLAAFQDRLFVVPRHGFDNTLVTVEGGALRFTPRLEELRQAANECACRVVILDNVAQLYGANENDRHQVTCFMNSLAGALPECAILLLSHPARGANSEFSGSSAWENCARTRLYLGAQLPDVVRAVDEEPPPDNVRFLARRKANYSTRDYRRFTFQDGVLVPDVVEASGGMVDHLRKQRAERVVIDGMRKLLERGVRVTDGATSSAYLPRALAEYQLAEGLTKKDLADAMRRAVMDGRLARGEVGRYPNRSPIMGLKLVDGCTN
jgi:hypothetical protein